MKHVVQFKGYFETRNCSVILMEYLQGGELFQYISSKNYRLTEAKCGYFATQILQAVEFIHATNIIHLDLKPENIVLTQKPPSNTMHYKETLKLIDFGIARNLGTRKFISINTCGTLEFISPEVLRSTHASPASDMWSVGVILFMMLSGGISPFWDGTEQGTERAIRRLRFVNGGFTHRAFVGISSHAIECVSEILVPEPSKYDNDLESIMLL